MVAGQLWELFSCRQQSYFCRMTDRPIRLMRVTTIPMSLKILLRGQLTWMQQQGFEVLAVSSDGPEVNDLSAEGLSHQVVPMARAITPVADLLALVRMFRLIRRYRPDIIHTHTPKAGLIGILAAWAAGVPVRFHTVAGLPLMGLDGWRRWLLVLTERLTYRCATRVLVNSASLLRYIDEHITAGTVRLSVLGNGSSNGIDTVYFSRTPGLQEQGQLIRREHSIPDDAPVFCFIGRLVRDKGIGELVDAFDRVRAVFPDARLLLVGFTEPERDPLDADTEARIRGGSGIHAPGYCEDVRPWLAAADVFVFPSYREGFPNVVLQAAAMRLPVIASDINGCNEIVEDGSTGWLVPAQDLEALTAAMLTALQNRSVLEELGRSGRQRVEERFDRVVLWKLIREAYLEAIREVQAET